MTRRAFVFGHPIGHSISPAIHNAAFRAHDLPVLYTAREVAPPDLARAIQELRDNSVLGANITVPYKQAVMAMVDEVDEEARAIGAANTIHNHGGRLRASNTDAAGFARSLADAGILVEGAAVLLLGAGGSARAVAQALLASGAASLLIANRTMERASLLMADLEQRFPAARIQARALDALLSAELHGRSLVVNTTTVGLQADESPVPAALLPTSGAVVDIIYNPSRTRLLFDAERAGLRTLNGLPMLVHQAALAWESWTGIPAPLEVMFAAARSAIEQPRPTAAHRPTRPRNLVLIGFSFTGKTTIARLLAHRLGWRYVDTDREIAQRTGRKPQEIFASEGEAAFRDVEREVVAELCRGRRQVIATGGGAPIDPRNRAVLFDGNIVVLLDATPEGILERLKNSRSGERRPMLDVPDPLERVRTLKAQRDPIYRQAHLVIETERLTPAESADLIYRLARVRG